MTSAPLAQDRTSLPRLWPIDLQVYDRAPFLRADEQEALDIIVERNHGIYSERWTSAAKGAIQRLLHPIADILMAIGSKGPRPTNVTSFLLEQMHHQQTTFWAWQQQDWVTLLGPNNKAFDEHFPNGQDYRQHLLAFGYLTEGITDLTAFGVVLPISLATKVFGSTCVEDAIHQVQSELLSWGHGASRTITYIPNVLAIALLTNRSPRLEDLTIDCLERCLQEHLTNSMRHGAPMLSRALVSLGILARPLRPRSRKSEQIGQQETLATIPAEWSEVCQRWFATTTLAPATRQTNYYQLLKIGRWLACTHPDQAAPAQWTREIAAECVAAVDRMSVGQWVSDKSTYKACGKPISPRTKDGILGALRVFFFDCQEWTWIPRHFDPRRCFSTPTAIQALIGPDPRVIAADYWAKLLWAGLNLGPEDLTMVRPDEPWYPLPMIRAMALIWLFAGLRANELRRLRVGCVHWQHDDVPVPGSDEVLPKDAVCWLDVPIHKTGTAFTKALDRLVGEAILAWEQVRPAQPAEIDPKTGEVVHYLFSYRGQHIGADYLNIRLIPMLCRKAGVPEADARGRITSHRARSTIASMLYNAKEPLSLFELQEWLGHRHVSSTQSYVLQSPTKVAKKYEKANYFRQNLRTVQVLLDQDAIKSGAAAQGNPWKFYDLGHGYCTYEFFDQCPHRMACAKCAFYRPKGSSQAQFLEGKANLQVMLQEIPLTEDERAAVEDDIQAMEQLCTRLADCPTPAGPTPLELTLKRQETTPLIPTTMILRRRAKDRHQSKGE